MAYNELKDHGREQRVFRSRALLAALLVVLLLGLLAARFYYLQVAQYDVYRTISDRNRMQLQAVVPTRGLIVDRKGRLLAENQPAFSLNIVPERVLDLEDTLNLLQEILFIPQAQLDSFRDRLQQARRPYASVPLLTRLTEDDIARFSVQRHRLPGVEVEADLIRHYPYAELTAHAVGYVGRISEQELARVDPAEYQGTQYFGKSGVERQYESQLHGRTGFRTVEVDVRGRVLQVLEQDPPVPGSHLELYLDVGIQRVAAEALGDRRGAVVVLDVATGGVLAMVSTPGFDPNLFVTGIDEETYGGLRDDPALPLFNRALIGQYPPGSTIKQFVALAGLNSGEIDRSTLVWDPGFYQINQRGRRYRDWKREGHGWVDVRQAIIQSCDVFFYDLATRIGVDGIESYLAKFGFGAVHALDIGQARRGVLPSREWKRAVHGEPWYPGDSLNLSIGQGYLLTTPLQLATATLVFARKGSWILPRMARSLDGREVPAPAPPPDIVLSGDDLWSVMAESMESVMHDKKGTAVASGRGASYRMAGKTGTAQVIGIPQGEEYDPEKIDPRFWDHGLFVGYVPADKPEIALAVVVENGGGGSSAAAPVGRILFDYWMEDDQPRGSEILTAGGDRRGEGT